MKNLLLLIILISCLNLTSCRWAPRDFVGYQCSPVFAYEDIAGKQFISVDDSKCFCRKYRVSQAYIGPLAEAVNEPLSRCDKIIGYSPVEYTDLTNLMEWVRVRLNSRNKNIEIETRE
jgi:hypothetical protein